jgi:hypothetical protein
VLAETSIWFTCLYFTESHEDRLLALILKMAKEQGLVMSGTKVMIFTVENEGESNEQASFRLQDIDEE